MDDFCNREINMKKLIILILIVSIFAITMPPNFVQIDRDCINPNGQTQDYVRYVNGIRSDVDPYETGTGIYVTIDSLGYDNELVLIQDDSTYYADTVFMKDIGWSR